MILEYTKDGLKVTHESGIIVLHTKEQLQKHINNNQQSIDQLANDNLRLAHNIEQIETAGG